MTWLLDLILDNSWASLCWKRKKICKYENLFAMDNCTNHVGSLSLHLFPHRALDRVSRVSENLFLWQPKQRPHEDILCFIYQSMPQYCKKWSNPFHLFLHTAALGLMLKLQRARKKPDCLCLHGPNYPALLIKTADRSSALSARFSLWPWCKIPWFFLFN